MQEHDRPGLELCIKLALEHVRETGSLLLRPSNLQLPIQLAPYDTSVSPLKGYEGGEFHPEKLGVACIIVPPTEGAGSNSKGDFGLTIVRTSSAPPPLLSDLSSPPQHFYLGEKATVPALVCWICTASPSARNGRSARRRRHLSLGC